MEIFLGFQPDLALCISKINDPVRSIYVKSPTLTPVYSQADPSKVVGSTVTTGTGSSSSSTTIYNSSASLFDMVSSTTLVYVAGGALVLYLVLS